MSTERPDNDVMGPRRRSPLAVASVATAVLLAGGGGAYWAATAADGEGRSDGSAGGGQRTAPPLALDGPAGTPTAPGANGCRVVYRVSGELPEGPRTAAVQRAEGTVCAAEVAWLAKALGLAGTPQAEGTHWKVGSEGDGSGPALRVDKQAPGTWSFARYGSSYLAKDAPSKAVPTPAPTASPGNTEESGPQPLSYRADGRRLSVTFWGGVCSTYTASATEGPDGVTVKVTEAKQPGKKVCIMIAKELTRTVTLDAPLGGRTVVDAASGGDVPRG